ncbi:MAG: transcription-repair coupling factor [Pseudobacteriovorax sp.]|nr:transcription-repair coupling factor [Pseudobacteriovorax sp.]
MANTLNSSLESALNEALLSIQPSFSGFKGMPTSFVGLFEEEQMILLQSLLSIINQKKLCGIIVVVCDSQKEIHRWYSLLSQGQKAEWTNIYSLPHFDHWGHARYSNKSSEVFQRLNSLIALQNPTGFSLVLTSRLGIAQYTIDIGTWEKLQLVVNKDDEIDIDDLISSLKSLGYFEDETVINPGTYSLRGGVLDIFSFHYQKPVRIEFFADDIRSIKIFDVDSQMSGEELQFYIISPAHEAVTEEARLKEQAQKLNECLMDQELVTRGERQVYVDCVLNREQIPDVERIQPLLRLSEVPTVDYIRKSIVFDFSTKSGRVRSLEMIEKWELQTSNSSISGLAGLRPEQYFKIELIESRLSQVMLDVGRTEGNHASWASIKYLNLPSDRTKLVAQLKKFCHNDKSVIIATPELKQIDKHLRFLESIHIEAHRLEGGIWQPSLLGNGKIYVGFGWSAIPVEIAHRRLLIIPDFMLSGDSLKNRGFSHTKTSPQSIKSILDNLKKIEPGTLVVHEEHGIGRFLSMSSLVVDQQKTDFMVLEYADGDKVYVPVDRLNKIQKFSDDDEKIRSLDKLKSSAWEKRKSKAKSAIKKLAFRLVEVYAKRKLAERKPYSPTGDIYYQFEEDFPFQETADQIRSISEVQEDLSNSYPMDRLLCGDVGFGKTEVALRAIMRVALDGFQAIVLAPTTVLTQQHFYSFTSRFSSFGIKVGLLNRFVSTKKLKETIEAFNLGTVDVLIGTSKVLSSKIDTSNTGIIIIDEEQRFGVGQKEKLRSLRASIDVLSLSATPIPRSLHMAVLGIKDISILTTPPVERKPVKTFTIGWDVTLIREAILKEVQRGGQVFFVHNRVVDILGIASKLRDIVPDISIRIAHGQMSEKELESTTIDFVDRKFSVLLSTSIIETGIDIPNANTIFINNANGFGLAQLYQMRGRVGRSERQGFAYLITSGNPNPNSEKRLELLAANQDLGAGFQVSSFDLDMRGAGDLLGAEQSGQSYDMGIDLFMEMLDREVRSIQGKEELKDRAEPEIKLGIDAYFAKTFIPSESVRIRIYKRLFTCRTLENVMGVQEELVNRFGSLNEPALAILSIAQIKVLMKAGNMSGLVRKAGSNQLCLKFSKLTKEILQRLERLNQIGLSHCKLESDYSVTISLVSVKDELAFLISTIQQIISES